MIAGTYQLMGGVQLTTFFNWTHPAHNIANPATKMYDMKINEV